MVFSIQMTSKSKIRETINDPVKIVWSYCTIGGQSIKSKVRAQRSVSRARLHQGSALTLQQLCDDSSNSVLIENNGVTPEWGCNLFSSDSIVFNEKQYH